MSWHTVLIFIFVVVLIDNEVCALEKASRQKRCIVIQKQGGSDDPSGGPDYGDYTDFKRPQPKSPRPDRLQGNVNDMSKKTEVEAITSELLKYQKIPDRAMYRRLKTKNRWLKNNFDLRKLLQR